jgi:hypothetical protein
MSAWQSTCGGDGRPTITDHTENLLHPAAEEPQHGYPSNFSNIYRGTRGRTSLDSTVSCIVCFDGAIDCVLMPCAHEVACHRCASRLILCPVCRQNVGSTLRVFAAGAQDQAAAAQQRQQQQEHAQEAEEQDAHPGEALERSGEAGVRLDNVVAADEEAARGAHPTDGADACAEAGAGGKGSGVATMLCLRCAAKPPNCIFLPCSHSAHSTAHGSRKRRRPSPSASQSCSLPAPHAVVERLSLWLLLAPPACLPRPQRSGASNALPSCRPCAPSATPASPKASRRFTSDCDRGRPAREHEVRDARSMLGCGWRRCDETRRQSHTGYVWGTTVLHNAFQDGTCPWATTGQAASRQRAGVFWAMGAAHMRACARHSTTRHTQRHRLTARIRDRLTRVPPCRDTNHTLTESFLKFQRHH